MKETGSFTGMAPELDHLGQGPAWALKNPAEDFVPGQL